MNGIADLADELARVDPRDVARYLRARGWRPLDRTWRGAAIWQSAGGTEIALPGAIQYADDTELVARVLHIVAEREERPVRSVLREVAEPLLDVQRFRTKPPGPSGTTPLLSGHKAVDGVKKAFDSAARAILEPETPPGDRGRGRSREVTGFLDTVRLGPSQTGSYVLTTQVPLDDGAAAALRRTWQEEGQRGTEERVLGLERLQRGPVQGRLFPPTGAGSGSGEHGGRSGDAADPLGRRVLTQLNTAMSAAGEALGAAERPRSLQALFTALDESMESGVSSHLCEALALLGGDDREQGFDIEFEWASALPRAGDAPPSEIAFAAGSARTLIEAAKYLREIEQAGTATINGSVIATESRAPNAGGAVKVEGYLALSTSKRQRRVWVRLGHSDYQRALDAHRSGRHVSVSGWFERRENRQELRADQFDPQ